MNWISVNDRLPERKDLMEDEREYVLVFLGGYRKYGGWGSVSICGYGSDGWDKYDIFGGWDVEEITHWMLLPEIPKEV